MVRVFVCSKREEEEDELKFMVFVLEKCLIPNLGQWGSHTEETKSVGLPHYWK